MKLTKQHRHFGDIIYKELNHLFDERVTFLQAQRECSFTAKRIISALKDINKNKKCEQQPVKND